MAGLGVQGSMVVLMIDGEAHPLVQQETPNHAMAFVHGFGVAMAVGTISQKRGPKGEPLTVDEIRQIIENTGHDMHGIIQRATDGNSEST